MDVITKHVETAFKKIGATVEKPVATRVPPAGEAQGVEEVKGRLRKMLLEQVQSDNFSRLWRLALAQSIVSETKEHAKKFPENESSFRLWKRAFCTVAAGCGKEISDLEEFEEITAALVKCDQVEESPWWTISLIPRIPRSQTETLAAAIFVPGKLLSKVAGTLSPHCHGDRALVFDSSHLGYGGEV